MARHTQSDREQAYRTYDGRLISARVIQRVLQDLDTRERRRAQWQTVRTWLLVVVLVVAAVIGTAALLWWRFSIHL